MSRTEKMNIFDNPNWFLTKCLLSSFGAWPLQSRHYRNIIRGIVTCLVLSILIPEGLRIFTVHGDINMLIECATTLLLHLLTVVKLINCFTNFDEGKELLMQIQTDRQSILSAVDNELLCNYENRSRKITHGYIYYIYATTITYMATPIVPKVLDYIFPLNESRPTIFLYQAEYFVDTDVYQDLILIHSYLITPLPATIVVAFDSLYANLVHHSCSMFLITSRRMEHLIHNHEKCNEHDCSGTEENHVLSDTFINCIKEHQKALDFAGLLRTTYSKALFCVIGINMIALSITGFQTVMKLDQPGELIRYGSYMIGQLIHLYFLSWPAQHLIDYSEYIHTAVYLQSWYNIPCHQQKFSTFIMMRSRKPCTLRAGKLYVMSLQNFSRVLKTSVSWFTVLSSLQ